MNDLNSILFLGDVIPYKAFKFRNDLKTIISLECPITVDGKPITGKLNLCVTENHLKNIFGSNLLAVSMCTNHIMDYGVEGLCSTINELEKGSIGYFGINHPGNNDHNPLIIKINGIRVALLSVVCESTAPLVEFDDFNYLTVLDAETLISQIPEIKRSADRLVVYIHWGKEESSYPSREDILTARKLIDSGIDVIIGSHAHAPQAVEIYGNGVIAYNLGNFIMPEFKNTPSYYDDDGVALSSFSKKLMLWNRISWGVAIDMKTLEFSVSKFVFIADRIIGLRATPYDKYMSLHPDILEDSYDAIISKQLRSRTFRRRFREYMSHPHIPKFHLKV